MLAAALTHRARLRRHRRPDCRRARARNRPPYRMRRRRGACCSSRLRSVRTHDGAPPHRDRGSTPRACGNANLEERDVNGPVICSIEDANDDGVAVLGRELAERYELPLFFVHVPAGADGYEDAARLSYARRRRREAAHSRPRKSALLVVCAESPIRRGSLSAAGLHVLQRLSR